MTVSTANQAYIFLATVYCGILIGLIYDIYRAIRMITKPRKWLIAIMDLIFWILAALLSFYMLFRVNGGEIRLYAFIGLALGWGLYSLTIGSIVVRCLVKVYEILLGIILWPIKILSKASNWIIKNWVMRIRKNKIS